MTEKVRGGVQHASERAVLSALEAEPLLDLLRELIRRPSENPPGGERAKAEYLAKYFESNGIEQRLEEVLDGRPNVIAEVGANVERTLVFNGHTDTVPAGEGWTLDPFAGTVRDGKVYGRGACDMLAGVAAMSVAAVALQKSGIDLEGRLIVHACIDEEVGGRGSKQAARDVEADWVIVTEPTEGDVEVRGKGQLNVDVTFAGRAAHSSRPESGHNAVHDAAAFITVVERENERLAQEPDPMVGPATYSTGIVRGGTSGSIVPAECTVVVDRRVLPAETLEEAERDVRALLDRLGRERPGMEATMRVTLGFPPLRPADNDNGLAATVLGVVKDLGQGDARLSGAVGATDAAWYAARGIPTIIFGPCSGATAHQPDEFALIDDIHLGARALALTAVRLLATPATGAE